MKEKKETEHDLIVRSEIHNGEECGGDPSVSSLLVLLLLFLFVLPRISNLGTIGLSVVKEDDVVVAMMLVL